MYIMPSEAGSPSRMMALLETSLNATGLEVNMGTGEQTPHRGSHRTSRREKEGQGKGVAWVDGQKRHLDRERSFRGTQKKRGTTTDIRGTAQGETDPHTGIGRKKDGEAADRFGHKEQRLFRAKEKQLKQKNNNPKNSRE